MPSNLNVQAQVLDIQNDTPKSSDSFLIDTNVWFWITYSKTGVHSPARTQQYTRFVSRALRGRAKLYYCGLSLAELAHLIEKAEREIYNGANCTTLTTKVFSPQLSN